MEDIPDVFNRWAKVGGLSGILVSYFIGLDDFLAKGVIDSVDAEIIMIRTLNMSSNFSLIFGVCAAGSEYLRSFYRNSNPES